MINKDTSHPAFGRVEHDAEGKPICHICGKSFHKLLAHVWQKHGMTAKEYKETFGLNTTCGIISDKTKKKLQRSVKKHYELVVIKNLIEGGKKTRFKKGSKGRTKDKLSEQERLRLKNLNKRKNIRVI